MKIAFRALTLLMLLSASACSSMLSWSPRQEAQDSSQSEYVPAPVEPDPLPQRPYGPNDHLVKKGDTLYSIAFHNQLDYRDLARWNNIGSDNRIYPGQVLRLNSSAPTAPRNGSIAAQGIDMNEVEKPQPLSTKPIPIVPGAPSTLPPIAAATPVPAEHLAPPSPATLVETPSGAGGLPGWRWPVDGTVVRGYNIDAGSRGLDFTGKLGQPVVAASAGKVVYSGSALKGYGELVIIKHDDLRLSAYGYNQRRLVNEGDVVAAGQQIAELGNGPENKPLLHFEIRERGKPVNPVPYLPAR